MNAARLAVISPHSRAGEYALRSPGREIGPLSICVADSDAVGAT